MPSLEKYRYIFEDRPATQKQPLLICNELENINSVANKRSPRLGLAPQLFGEGYVIYFKPFREKIMQLLHEEQKTGEPQEINGEELESFCTQVASALFEDEYARAGKAITLCTFTNNGRTIGKNLAAEARVVYGKSLEVKDLVTPIDENKDPISWGELLPENACELGKVVVAEELRGWRTPEKSQTTEIIQHMIDAPRGVVEVAQKVGSTKIATIGKKQFIKHTRGSKLDFGERYDIMLTPTGNAIAQIYDGYWNDEKDPPGLYIADVPERKRLLRRR